MKPTLLTLSSILFAFISMLLLPLTSSFNVEQVHDTNGHPIFPGGQYYIMPAPTQTGKKGGGLAPHKTGNSTCPVTVLQEYSNATNGVPAKFLIPVISPGIIFTGTPLDITFTKKPNCAESSMWVVVSDDFPEAWVGIGGHKDHLGNKMMMMNGTFSIELHEYDQLAYKLVFCPFVKGEPSRVCSNIGRYHDKIGSRLILTHKDAFPVVFVDARARGQTATAGR